MPLDLFEHLDMNRRALTTVVRVRVCLAGVRLEGDGAPSHCITDAQRHVFMVDSGDLVSARYRNMSDKH
jgi:hypothetical protein